MAKTSLSGPVQVSGQDVYDSGSSTQQMLLGVYGETQDGRGYRYCKVGAVATVSGKVYQSAALDATTRLFLVDSLSLPLLSVIPQ